MVFEIVKLTFEGPLHLARGRAGDDSGEDILHSDTLKSALFAAAMDAGLGADMGQDEQTKVCPFLDAFSVSSAFPFLGGEYFFPKPKNALHDIESDDEDFNEHKAKKEIRYIGQSFFEELLLGEYKQRKIKQSEILFDAYYSERPLPKQYVSDHPDALRADYLMASELTMRVAVPRHYEQYTVPTPYYSERLFFHEDAGLYFFIAVHDEKYRHQIETALEALGENGLGSDKGSGNGCFSPQWTKLSINVPTTSSHRLLLSLCCPTKAMVTAKHPAYSLIKRGGWVANAQDMGQHTTFRKRSLYMFEEGSVLSIPKNENFGGTLHSIKPDVMGNTHPVWRDGRSFSLPINLI